jgi:hypothetical protein
MCKGSTIHTPYLGLKKYFSHPRGTLMIEVALKDCNAKSYSGNYFLCAIASMSLSITLFMLSLYVYHLLHCKLTKKFLFQWKKTSFIVIFLGTRQEMKIKKQNKIFSFCCFLLFCLPSFFLWIFLDSSCESIRLCSFCQKKKQKKVLCERLRSGK